MALFNDRNISLEFPDHWQVTKYDDWAFYRNKFTTSCCGNKAVDFLAYDPDSRTLWLIELKDYRQHHRAKTNISIWDEIAIKTRDTLAGIFAAKIDMTHAEHSYAVQFLRADKIRVVLHLEQPRTPSKLFPQAYSRADVEQKLRQIVRPIDHHPKVVEAQHMGNLPWIAQ